MLTDSPLSNTTPHIIYVDKLSIIVKHNSPFLCRPSQLWTVGEGYEEWSLANRWPSSQDKYLFENVKFFFSDLQNGRHGLVGEGCRLLVGRGLGRVAGTGSSFTCSLSLSFYLFWKPSNKSFSVFYHSTITGWPVVEAGLVPSLPPPQLLRGAHPRWPELLKRK